jgi:hypothetical protein
VPASSCRASVAVLTAMWRVASASVAGAASGTAAKQQSGKKRKQQREAGAAGVQAAAEQPTQSSKKKRRSQSDAEAADGRPHDQPLQASDTQHGQDAGADPDAVVKGSTRDKAAAKAAKRTGKKLSAW